MRQEILAQLDRLPGEHDVRLLLAIESGSRAWGFPSRDSDFDVRLIYAKPRAWYLAVFEPRDVLELPIHEGLDLSGWELRKALRLLGNGNAVVHEWLASPIVYRSHPAAERLRELARRAFRPRAAFHHYLAMSRGRLTLEEGEAFTAKRLLYGLRTLLCAGFVAERRCAPPMRLAELLGGVDPEVRREIEAVVDAKGRGDEADRLAAPARALAFARERLEQLRQVSVEEAAALPAPVFDAAFLEMLDLLGC